MIFHYHWFNHRKNHDLHIYLERMMSDLSKAISYIQEPILFKVIILTIIKNRDLIINK